MVTWPVKGKFLAQSSADPPTSKGASADEGTTRLPQRVNKSEDRSALPLTNCAQDLLNVQESTSNTQPGTTIQFAGYHGDYATTQGASIGEKDVSSMVGCTIGDIVPIDVSGQNRNNDLSVGQGVEALSLPADAYIPNYVRKLETYLHNTTRIHRSRLFLTSRIKYSAPMSP